VAGPRTRVEPTKGFPSTADKDVHCSESLEQVTMMGIWQRVVNNIPDIIFSIKE